MILSPLCTLHCFQFILASSFFVFETSRYTLLKNLQILDISHVCVKPDCSIFIHVNVLLFVPQRFPSCFCGGFFITRDVILVLTNIAEIFVTTKCFIHTFLKLPIFNEDQDKKVQFIQFIYQGAEVINLMLTQQ